jgi:hypothetical protein
MAAVIKKMDIGQKEKDSFQPNQIGLVAIRFHGNGALLF